MAVAREKCALYRAFQRYSTVYGSEEEVFEWDGQTESYVNSRCSGEAAVRGSGLTRMPRADGGGSSTDTNLPNRCPHNFTGQTAVIPGMWWATGTGHPPHHIIIML